MKHRQDTEDLRQILFKFLIHGESRTGLVRHRKRLFQAAVCRPSRGMLVRFPTQVRRQRRDGIRPAAATAPSVIGHRACYWRGSGTSRQWPVAWYRRRAPQATVCWCVATAHPQHGQDGGGVGRQVHPPL